MIFSKLYCTLLYAPKKEDQISSRWFQDFFWRCSFLVGDNVHVETTSFFVTTRGGVVLPSLKGETATHLLVFTATTVDGSEIWRSPVEVGSLSYNHIIYKVYISQVVSRISEPSTVGCGFKRYLLQHGRVLLGMLSSDLAG